MKQKVRTPKEDVPSPGSSAREHTFFCFPARKISGKKGPEERLPPRCSSMEPIENAILHGFGKGGNRREPKRFPPVRRNAPGPVAPRRLVSPREFLR